MQQKTMKFALSIKLQLLFNFIINIMLKLVIYINGLLLAYKQWGSSNVTHIDTTVTFPIAFNVLYSVVGVPKSSGNLSGHQSNFGVKSQNNTSFIANMYDNGNGYAGFNWCAFGKA